MSNPVQLTLSWIALLGICHYFVSCLHKKSTREDWWGATKFITKVDAVSADGKRSLPQNYQQQLPSFNSVSNSASNFYQVPGTYDSTLPPRFSSIGMSSKVAYNLPQVDVMALDPNNPTSAMSIASCVQAPAPVKESFNYGNATMSQMAQEDTEKLQKDSTVIAASTLPVPSMVRTHQEQSASVPTNTPTVSYDRFIVANLSRQRGQGDWIRGDLFINPILPNTDANSPIWFRPSQGTEVLNTGAMSVLGGVWNETSKQTAQLAMQGNGGSNNCQGGIAWAPPASTSVGAQMAQNAMAMSTSKASGTLSLGDIAVNTSMYA